MQVRLSWADDQSRILGEDTVFVDDGCDESRFWEKATECLPDLPIPCNLTVRTDTGEAQLMIHERGTYLKNGVEYPSMFVTGEVNTIALPESDYSEKFLVCVNPESKGGYGSYKYYRFLPDTDGIWGEYGRIGNGWRRFCAGARKTSEPYPRWLYWAKLREKLSKGYIDLTEAYLARDEETVSDEESSSQSVPDTVSAGLYRMLLALANNRVQQTFVFAELLNTKLLSISEAYVEELHRQTSVEGFNEVMVKLMGVLPRNASCVSSYLAKSTSDFRRILANEESLLDAMRAVVDSKIKGPTKGVATSFEDFGIKIRKATREEIASDIAPNLSPRLNSKVESVWVVEPERQRNRFTRYCDDRNITPRQRKLLWHGSHNENWCSIIQHSLMLNPNAVRTGSMFGHGLYFSMESGNGRGEKSFNYTSYSGAYWTRGTGTQAFMGLYECAYGKPFYTTTCGAWTQADMDRDGKDCLHARAGVSGLRNEEIVFFAEEAVVLKYLVEFM